MSVLKLILCKDRKAAELKAHKLSVKENGVYLVISRKRVGKAYVVKLQDDATYVGLFDGRTKNTKTKVSK